MLTTNLTVIDLFVLAGIGEERDACGSPFRTGDLAGVD